MKKANKKQDYTDDDFVDFVLEMRDYNLSRRMWIGKLCWFWSGDKNNRNFCRILKDFTLFSKTPYVDDDSTCWEHCEPVRPDDDIIYKGE